LLLANDIWGWNAWNVEAEEGKLDILHKMSAFWLAAIFMSIHAILLTLFKLWVYAENQLTPEECKSKLLLPEDIWEGPPGTWRQIKAN
jgi:hypothetical protein